MQDGLITYEQLIETFGGSSIAELVVRLKEQNIPYKLGKRGRPMTTFTAMNHSMGIPLNSPFLTEPEKNILEVD